MLQGFLSNKQSLIILTGAGISAGSGIPTYRDANGDWQRSTPIQHGEFINQPSSRQRYWLRSYAGWPAVNRAEPTFSHKAITHLEESGVARLVVTQNVDRLHQKAGTRRVIDLHGRLDRVVCLECQAHYDRQWFQQQLKQVNPFLAESDQLAPDGDAHVESCLASQVDVPDCPACSSTLKPDVVFFGGQVSKDIVEEIYRSLDNADGLLIIGSSLKVFSGYRFSRYAASLNLPVAAINPGKMRGEELIGTMIRCDADRAFHSLRK